MDPCDLRLKSGDGALRDLVARRTPLFEFAIHSALTEIDLESAEGPAARPAAAPLSPDGGLQIRTPPCVTSTPGSSPAGSVGTMARNDRPGARRGQEAQVPGPGFRQPPRGRAGFCRRGAAESPESRNPPVRTRTTRYCDCPA